MFTTTTPFVAAALTLSFASVELPSHRCPMGESSTGGSGGVRGTPGVAAGGAPLCAFEPALREDDEDLGRPRCGGTALLLPPRSLSTIGADDDRRSLAAAARLGPSSSLDESESTTRGLCSLERFSL
uniref:Putative secreted protein n=1 Tax=Ixodes ricinus TaxID=34613 RepID=A0A6B0UR31_IXORI